MKNNILTLAIVLTVGVILTGSLLMPILSDYAESEKTYTNLGMPFAEVDDSTHTIVVNSDGITVDDTEIDLTLFPGTFPNYSIVYSEHGFVRWDKTNVMYSCNKESGSAAVIAQFDCSTNTVTIEISGSTATVSSSDTTVTPRQISDVLCYIAPEGKYTLSLNPYVTDESQMIAGGITVFTNPLVNLYLVWNGTIEEITSLVLAVGGGYDATVADPEINTTAITTNLVKIDSITFDVELAKDGNTYDRTATYTYFVVPAKVVYENGAYLGDAESSLIGAIPVLVIISLVLLGVGAIGLRNRD